jgi:UDP-glucuronate 4-epimerase
MAHSYSYLYGIQCIGLRFFTVYGEAGRPDMATWIFTDKILNDDPIPVFNNGQMQRDFTYIDDIVSGVNNAVFKAGLQPFDIYNLGNHQSIPLLDMITVLEDALGKKAVKNMLPMQPGDVMATYADISKAQQDLDFQPETSIDVGIPAFCKWLSDNPDISRDVYQWRQRG